MLRRHSVLSNHARAAIRLKIKLNAAHVAINTHSNGRWPGCCSNGPKKAKPAISIAPDRQMRMLVTPPGTAKLG